MHTVNEILTVGASLYFLIGVALVFIGIALCKANQEVE